MELEVIHDYFIKAFVGGLTSTLIGFCIYFIKSLRASILISKEIDKKLDNIQSRVDYIEKNYNEFRALDEANTIITLYSILYIVKHSAIPIEIGLKGIVEDFRKKCLQNNVNGSTTAIFDELEILFAQSTTSKKTSKSRNIKTK